MEAADEDEAPTAAEIVVAVVAQEEGPGAGEGGLPATADLTAAPEQAGLDAAQEGVLDRVAPAVLAEMTATVAELEPGASLEEAARPAEPAAVAQVTIAEVVDEDADNAESDLEEPAAVAEVAAAAIVDEEAGADAEPGAAAADTSQSDDIVDVAAAADVAAGYTPEGAQGTQPAETSFEIAQVEGSAQLVPEVAEKILEVTLPAVVTSQGATAEDVNLTADASLAAEDFDSGIVGASEGADRAGRVVDDEDFIPAAALAQDFDAAEDIAAEQALITAAVLAAEDFAEADEADERAAKDAGEQSLITAGVVAVEEYYGMEDEPGLQDSEGQAVGAAEGDEGNIEGKSPRLMAV